jgi:transcriptional regulator with XRE-family HTH domain
MGDEIEANALKLSIAGRLREELLSEKVSVEDAADRLCIAPKELRNIMLGVVFPSIPLLVHAADMFGVTTDYLLGRTATRE